MSQRKRARPQWVTNATQIWWKRSQTSQAIKDLSAAMMPVLVSNLEQIAVKVYSKPGSLGRGTPIGQVLISTILRVVLWNLGEGGGGAGNRSEINSEDTQWHQSQQSPSNDASSRTRSCYEPALQHLTMKQTINYQHILKPCWHLAVVGMAIKPLTTLIQLHPAINDRNQACFGHSVVPRRSRTWRRAQYKLYVHEWGLPENVIVK